MENTASPYSVPTGTRPADGSRANGGLIVVDESWIKVLAKFGLGGGLAAFLVWQLAGDIKTNTTQTNAAISLHVTETKTQSYEHTRILQGLLNVAIQQCVNATTVPAKRDACFDAINKGIWVRDSR